jgi:hypothetical protein
MQKEINVKTALLAILALCVFEVGCSRPTKVTGNVFLFSRAMTNLPQGGVNLYVFKEAEFRQRLIEIDKDRALTLNVCQKFNSGEHLPPENCIKAQNSGPTSGFLSDGPRSVASGKSDAAGNFEFVIPKQGEYILFAESPVESPWIETLHANGGDLRIVLNDSNLMPDYQIRALFIYE